MNPSKEQKEQKDSIAWLVQDETVIGLSIVGYCLLFVLTAIIGHLPVPHVHAAKKFLTWLLCGAWAVLIISWSLRLHVILTFKMSENEKIFSG